MRTRLKDLYLEYVNEWLTIEALAEHHNINMVTMGVLVELGQEYIGLNQVFVICYKNFFNFHKSCSFRMHQFVK